MAALYEVAFGLVLLLPVVQNGSGIGLRAWIERLSGKAHLLSSTGAWEDPMSTTRGVLYVHSTPSALCPHIEWAVGGVFGMPTPLSWQPQPVERGSYRAERTWTGPIGTAARLASALGGWRKLRFEVSEDPAAGSEGERYCGTPTLGMFRATTGVHGDIMVSEDRIKDAMARAALGHADLADALDRLLGRSWDDELEPFRHAGEHSPVRWLHQVV